MKRLSILTCAMLIPVSGLAGPPSHGGQSKAQSFMHRGGRSRQETGRAGSANRRSGDGVPPPPPDIQNILIHGRKGTPSLDYPQDNRGFRNGLPASGLALSPRQIEQYRLLQLQSALASHAVTNPHVIHAPLLRVNLAPGQVSPPIDLALGFGSAVTFEDATGAPWPIESFVLGNNVAFNAVVPKSKDHNVLIVSSQKVGAGSDVVVTLKGLNSPVVLLLHTPQTDVDPRVLAQIDRRGPDAAQPVFVPGPSMKTASPGVLDALNGISPPHAHRIYGSGRGLEVWRAGNVMYVRSHAKLRLPTDITQQASVGGYTAWQLPYTPNITLSRGGHYHTVSLP